jgi:hypothetical protein
MNFNFIPFTEEKNEKIHLLWVWAGKTNISLLDTFVWVIHLLYIQIPKSENSNYLWIFDWKIKINKIQVKVL